MFKRKKEQREGISLIEFFDIFPTDRDAEEFIIKQRWPDGVRCPKCDGDDVYEPGKKAPMRFRCRPCRRFFSTKSGTPMAHSNISYQKWLTGIYLLCINLTGISSLKVARSLRISRKAAWHLGHRIREGWSDQPLPMDGTVEVDETYVGGKERNKHWNKKLPQRQQIWRGVGTQGKVIVAGAKCRETNQVTASVVTGTSRKALGPFLKKSVDMDARLFTDSHAAYEQLGYNREVVNHKQKEYVRGEIHTNGIEAFWSMFKRGFKGTYFTMSHQHLQRYVSEFTGRHNIRSKATIEQLAILVRGMVGKQLKLHDLMGSNA